MHVIAISPNRQHLRELGTVLEGAGHKVDCHEGGKSRMAALAEEVEADVMLVDGMCCDPAELQHIEHVTAAHPELQVVLLCATHSPEFLIQAMRAGVREVLPSPPLPADMLAAVERLGAKRRPPASREYGRVLAFLPCKGGSGATFLATNVAWLLAERSSVLLVDLNLQFGDALSFLQEGPAPGDLSQLARDIGRLDASLLAATAAKVAPTLGVLSSPPDPAHAGDIRPEHVEALLQLAVRHYDFVVLDLPRTLDPNSLRALDRAHRIYPVLQQSVPAVRHARQLLDVFRTLGYPAERVEPVLNRHDRRAELSVEQVRRALGVHSLHSVPNSFRDVNASVDHGEPLVRIARTGTVGRVLADFTRELRPAQDDQPGLFGRLFRRA